MMAGMIILLTGLLRGVRTQRSLVLENLALRHQLAVLQRTVPRPQLRSSDRLFWVLLSRLWSGWADAVSIVQPATVIRWQRIGFKLFWRNGPGRPTVAPAVRALIQRMSTANPLWGAPRIHGELQKLGVGISQGYATLGQIGFSERSGYTAIGTVCNVAARLRGEAKDGQILLSQRVNVALKGSVATEQVGALALKGFTQPVVAYNVPLVGSQAALRVIEGGPPSAN